LGWTHKETTRLIKRGLTGAQIAGCLDAGASYADIKKLIDTKQLDELEAAMFNPMPIISNMELVKRVPGGQTAAELVEFTAFGLARLVFKCGRRIVGK